MAAGQADAQAPGQAHGGTLRHSGALRLVLASHCLRIRLPHLLLLARHGHHPGRPLPGSHDEGALKVQSVKSPTLCTVYSEACPEY